MKSPVYKKNNNLAVFKLKKQILVCFISERIAKILFMKNNTQQKHVTPKLGLSTNQALKWAAQIPTNIGTTLKARCKKICISNDSFSSRHPKKITLIKEETKNYQSCSPIRVLIKIEYINFLTFIFNINHLVYLLICLLVHLSICLSLSFFNYPCMLILSIYLSTANVLSITYLSIYLSIYLTQSIYVWM